MDDQSRFPCHKEGLMVDALIWSGIGAIVIFNILAMSTHNNLFWWLDIGIMALTMALGIKKRRLFKAQKEDVYQRQVEFVAEMMLTSLLVASIFLMLAESYHMAIFWWVVGLAMTAFGVLGLIVGPWIKRRQRKAREREQQATM